LGLFDLFIAPNNQRFQTGLSGVGTDHQKNIEILQILLKPPFNVDFRQKACNHQQTLIFP
jgi:hypothetical protein